MSSSFKIKGWQGRNKLKGKAKQAAARKSIALAAIIRLTPISHHLAHKESIRLNGN